MNVNKTLQTLLLPWMLLIPALAGASNLSCPGLAKHITDVDLQFSLTHNQIPGQLAVSHHKLRVAGNHYKLESVSQAKGLLALVYSGQLTQKSEGLLDSRHGFAPLYYAEQRGKKPLAEATIDVKTKQVLFRKNGETAVFEAGLQDRLSMIYQLSARLQCKADFQPGDVVPMRVMSTGRVGTETWTFKSAETMTVDLGQGERSLTVWLFESRPEDDKDEVVRIWYAKDLGWKPAKIQIQDADGKSLTQTLIGSGKSAVQG
ncbi:MAG TPA: DUF3108 domain-containing protein [Limnobacter sp.]|nr:DUF3108 domain-containing protein [Limnobacter sp.]